MKAAPMRAERIIPSQMGGSGSFMCVVDCAGGGTQRGWLGANNKSCFPFFGFCFFVQGVCSVIG